MSDLNRIKPAFRTKGSATGNFGKAKVKAGSTLDDIGVTKAEVINITEKKDYMDRLLKAYYTTDDENLRSFIWNEIKREKIRGGSGLQRFVAPERTAPPYRTPGC